jgi:DNA polymerase V
MNKDPQHSHAPNPSLNPSLKPPSGPAPMVTPLFGKITCGFPSPATEYLECSLNLHDYVVKKPAATFFMRAEGDSMQGLGIFPGDILVVDRSITPRSGHVVVASIDGAFTLKQLKLINGKPFLYPAHPQFKPIEIHNPEDLQIFGVVTFNLHAHL